MRQAVPHIPPSAHAPRVSPDALAVSPAPGSDQHVPDRSGERPLAAPVPPRPRRAAVIDGLRQRVARIEGVGPDLAREGGMPRSVPRWTLGVPEIDLRLGAGGIDASGLHEVKPAAETCCAAGVSAAATGFALRLAARRIRAMSDAGGGGDPRRIVLWCETTHAAREDGAVYGHGLAALGLDPSLLIVARAAREEDCLWAIEEGLKSGVLALVVARVPGLDLTPARRLSLAAKAGRTPCLAVTSRAGDAAAATATRWHVAPAPRAAHPFDPRAPGAARFSLLLARHRVQHLPPMISPSVVEWSDETCRFRLASPLADRADAPRVAAGGAC